MPLLDLEGSRRHCRVILLRTGWPLPLGWGRRKAAVVGARQVVDSSFPKAAGWQVGATQEQTRKFWQDQGKAEVGRENRKLVDRLQKISGGIGESEGVRVPRAELRGRSPHALHRPASAAALRAAGGDGESRQQPRSRADPPRWKTQRAIEQDTLGLVRPILGSSCSRAGETEDFARHRRGEQLLRRIAEGRRPRCRWSSGGLPRPLAPAASPGGSMTRELHGLFFLADLQRAGQGQLAVERAATAVGRLAGAQHDGLSGTLLPAASLAPEPMEMAAAEPGETAAAGLEGTPGRAQTWGGQNCDEETARRRWSGLPEISRASTEAGGVPEGVVQEPAWHGDSAAPPMSGALSYGYLLQDLAHMPTDTFQRYFRDDLQPWRRVSHRPRQHDAVAELAVLCSEDWNDASVTSGSPSAAKALGGSRGPKRRPRHRHGAALGGQA
ncbi:unnamed protein product [Prorocentrum cordatum]|uniref:Uncharacterized protein n=1 Tax=Prorocentrum cordatum TaxID=2364126 RepID=A0ABN9UNZ9_9DINO|nr:unnamed protein product [Polarella glacialis]